MKKSLVALAVLASVAGTAAAQSSVTLYGVVDVNAQYASGEVKSLQSGGLNGSRWGLRGVEDLGGGLKAVFTAESGFNADEGTSGQGGLLFGRQVWVGLASDLGTVRLGRQYSPIGLVADTIPGTKGYDALTVSGAVAANGAYRINNAVSFLSNNYGGLTFSAQASTGQADTDGANYGVSAGYNAGPISVNAGYHHFKSSTTGTEQAGLIVGSFDFGMAKVTAYYDKEGRRDESFKMFGGIVSVPFGAAKVALGYAKADNTSGVRGLDDDATIITLQGQYDLSKRTALYAHYTKLDNKNGSNLTFASVPAVYGNDRQGVQFGVRHAF